MDKWSYFEALGILKKEFGCSGNLKLWWKSAKGSFEHGLKEIYMDKHALELANYAINNKCEVKIYVEHEEITTLAMNEKQMEDN